MISNMIDLFKGIEKGDVINDKDTVTGSSVSLIYTDGPTYTIRGSDERYKRVKKVTRDGELIYKSRYGGNRRGPYDKKACKYVYPGKPSKPKQIRCMIVLKRVCSNRLASLHIRLRKDSIAPKEVEYNPGTDAWKISNILGNGFNDYKSTKYFRRAEQYFLSAMVEGDLYQDGVDVDFLREENRKRSENG